MPSPRSADRQSERSPFGVLFGPTRRRPAPSSYSPAYQAWTPGGQRSAKRRGIIRLKPGQQCCRKSLKNSRFCHSLTSGGRRWRDWSEAQTGGGSGIRTHSNLCSLTIDITQFLARLRPSLLPRLLRTARARTRALAVLLPRGLNIRAVAINNEDPGKPRGASLNMRAKLRVVRLNAEPELCASV